MNKRSWLEIVEYLFLAGSLAGTIAAIATHQVAYAAVPLTLALFLNAVNRYRYQRYERRSVAKMQQSVQSLQQQVQALPSEPGNSASLVQALKQLEQENVTLSEQFNARPETQAIVQLADQLDALTLRLDNLPQAKPINLSGIEAEIATLQANLQAVDLSSIKQLEQENLTLSEQFNARPETQAIVQLADQLDALRLRLDNLPQAKPIDLSGIEAEIATLQANLQAFDLSSSDSSIAQVQTELQDQINQLKGQFQQLSQPFDGSALDQRLTDLKDNYTIYRDDVIRLVPAVQNLQSEQARTNSAIAELASQLEVLALSFQSLPTVPETVDLSEIQAAIANLNLQLNNLSEQFLARTEPTAIQRLDGIVETQISQLAVQLDALSQQFNTRTELQAIEHLKKTIAELQHSLEALAAVSAAVEAPSEIEAPITKDEAIAAFATKQELDTLTQGFTLAIEELSGAIAQLPHSSRQSEEFPDQVDASVEQLNPDVSMLPIAEFNLEDLFADQLDASVEQLNPDASMLPSAEFNLEDLFADQLDASVKQSNPDPSTPQGAVLNLEDLFGDQVDVSVEQLNEALASLPPGSDLDLEDLLFALTPKSDASKSSKND